MKRKKIDTKFKPGQSPWNKGLVGYGSGRVVSNETREKLRVASTGRKHSAEARAKISEAKKKLCGSLNPFYGRKHSEHANLLNGQASRKRWQQEAFRKLVFDKRKGKQAKEFNPRWAGGITKLHQMIRDCEKYSHWRYAVFVRDQFSCQSCGVKHINIEAHHKKQFSVILKDFLTKYNQFSPVEDKETLVRLASGHSDFWLIDNGVTLCKDCHKTKGGDL